MTVMLTDVIILGFVLTGIPVYYITHRNDPDVQAPWIIGTACSQLFTVSLAYQTETGYIMGLIGRSRGRPPQGSGWQAVATDGDEQVEMRAHT